MKDVRSGNEVADCSAAEPVDSFVAGLVESFAPESVDSNSEALAGNFVELVVDSRPVVCFVDSLFHRRDSS